MASVQILVTYSAYQGCGLERKNAVLVSLCLKLCGFVLGVSVQQFSNSISASRSLIQLTATLMHNTYIRTSRQLLVCHFWHGKFETCSLMD